MIPSTASPPRRRWFQFRLRTLLLFVTVLALPLAWFSNSWHRAEQQHDAVAKLAKMDFAVEYDQREAATEEEVSSIWDRKWFGIDFGDRVKSVRTQFHYSTNTSRFPGDVYSPAVAESRLFSNYAAESETLRLMRDLPDLRFLNLSYRRIDDDSLPNLGPLSKLRMLDLSHTKVSGDGLACLVRMPELAELDLNSTRLTDAGLVHLQSLPRLKILDLGRTNISAEGLECLNALTALEELRLSETNIQAADLGKLKMPRLKRLYAHGIGGNRELAAEPVSPQLFDGLPNLETLDLRAIDSPPGLKEAILRRSNLRTLHLPKKFLSTTDLIRLDQLTNLHELDLADANITDAELHLLACKPDLLPALRTITLDAWDEDGPLTWRGFTELQRARPRLEIFYPFHKSGPVCCKFSEPFDAPP